MLSYEEIRWIKKFLERTGWVFGILLLIILLTYSCNLDFSFREKYLPKNTVNYQEGMTKTPIQTQNTLYNKELGLEITGQIQLTGAFLGANSDIIRTNCPFQKERVKLYNKYFQAIILSVKGQPIALAAAPQSRLIRQLLTKLSDDEWFMRTKFNHKITLFGYVLKLRDYPEINFNHIVITKMILDGKIYE